MDITWYGHSCFRLSERGRATAITDPYDESVGYGLPKLKGDVVTISHTAPGHSNAELVKGALRVIETPGEYEVGNVFVIGLPMHNITSDPPKRNVAYLFNYDGLTVVHLGDLDHVPSQSELEALGSVKVALVPVGGGGALNSTQAAEVIGLIEPAIVIPMHYQMESTAFELDPLERFLREMGISHVQEEDVLRVSAGALPESTQVVVLKRAG